MNPKRHTPPRFVAAAVLAIFSLPSLHAAVVTDPALVTAGNKISPYGAITHTASNVTAESTLEARSDLSVLQNFSSLSGASNIVSFTNAALPDISIAGSSGSAITSNSFLSSLGSGMRIQTSVTGWEYTHTVTVDFGSYNGSTFDGSEIGVVAAGFTLNSTPFYVNATSRIVATFLDADNQVLATQSFAGSMSGSNYRIHFGYQSVSSSAISSIRIDITSTASGAALIYGLDDLSFTPAISTISRLELLRRVAEDPALQNERAVFLARADKVLALPVIRRPHSLEELEASRISWDPRYDTADESIREVFALARSDAMALSDIVSETADLASAHAVTGRQAYLDRLLAQLDEISGWDPLQRPGWTSFSTGQPPAPEGDGVWLATGRGIQACIDSLDMLPADAVPPELREKITVMLKREVARIEGDWRAKRPWYVASDAVYSNQWALPLAGLVNASLWLNGGSVPAPGSPYADSYEFGVVNLLRTLDSQGPRGEFVEGPVYAVATIGALLSPADHCTRAGDRRLIDHPFLQNYPTWQAHLLQPGGYVLNAFDCGFGARGGLRHFATIYSDLAVMLRSPEALWVVKQYALMGGKEDSINGVIALTLPDAYAREPVLFASYPVATRVNWRSNWNDDDIASGFWMRGGHATDRHDHMDRGHVNFIVDGRAILIEAGTPGYGDPRLANFYRSVAGHNVLQVGDFDPATATAAQFDTGGQPLDRTHREAPLTVIRLDTAGGEATADMSAVYSSVKKWVRHVKWSARTLVVRDEVQLKSADIALFRWHLGSPVKDVRWSGGMIKKEDVELTPGRLTAPGYSITYSSDRPLTGRLETMPDVTLGNQSEHHTLVVRSANPVTSLTLTTTVQVD